MSNEKTFRRGLVQAGGGQPVVTPPARRVGRVHQPPPSPAQPGEDPRRIKLRSVREREAAERQTRGADDTINTNYRSGLLDASGQPFRRGLSSAQVDAQHAAGVPTEPCMRCGEKYPPQLMRQVLQAAGGHSGGIRVCTHCAEDTVKDLGSWKPQSDDVTIDSEGRVLRGTVSGAGRANPNQYYSDEGQLSQEAMVRQQEVIRAREVRDQTPQRVRGASLPQVQAGGGAVANRVGRVLNTKK